MSKEKELFSNEQKVNIYNFKIDFNYTRIKTYFLITLLARKENTILHQMNENSLQTIVGLQERVYTLLKKKDIFGLTL